MNTSRTIFFDQSSMNWIINNTIRIVNKISRESISRRKKNILFYFSICVIHVLPSKWLISMCFFSFCVLCLRLAYNYTCACVDFIILFVTFQISKWNKPNAHPAVVMIIVKDQGYKVKFKLYFILIIVCFSS
jgi:hypothetical protein